MVTRWRYAGMLVALGVAAGLAWLATTDTVAVWPVRNTLQYRLLTTWWTLAGATVDWDQQHLIERLRHQAPREPEPAVSPGSDLRLGAPERVASAAPISASATRRTISFQSAGQPSQPALLYTPEATADPSPLLLVVYPGPAAEWESASVPLAAAGYAVVAAGPPYSFTIERDVDELERLARFGREALLPGVDGTRVAVLGGSYSALHVQRLVQRDAGRGRAIQAAVLMGAPVDLFDMRRRLEERTFVSPFGLDQALIALGLPDREPARYFRYSGAYHVTREMPPHLVVHSRQDAVVPYQQSELLARALAEAGVPYELHILDGGSHYLLSDTADARAIYDLTVRFLRAHA